MKIDIHQAITDQIIAALEAGAASTGRRWLTIAGMPQRVTGDEYRGINALILSLIGQANGYAAPTWMTFNQAKQLGGAVRKGEKSSMVVFYKKLEVERENDRGEEETVGIPMLRQYGVFNVDQIDGLPDRFRPAPPILPSKQRNDMAEAALRSSGAAIREGGNAAFYDRARDHVQLPDFDVFRTVDLFLATMAHELVHWTGAPDRLDRAKGSQFGDRDYAFEELVAEIGAAFVCGRIGVAADHIDDHAAYVASWLQALKNDKKHIFRAAALAQSAADMVLANASDADRVGVPTQHRAAPPVAAPRQAAFAWELYT